MNANKCKNTVAVDHEIMLINNIGSMSIAGNEFILKCTYLRPVDIMRKCNFEF